MNRIFTAMIFCGSLVALLACDPAPESRKPVADSTEKLFYNARVHTMNSATPLVGAVLIKDGNIAHAGTLAEARALAGKDVREYDLGGRTIIPGIVDAHTHPGLVSVLGGGEEEAVIPKTNHADIMAWLEQHIRDNPFEFFISYGEWPSGLYGSVGPNKKDLDEIAGWRPVLLFDDSGHSIWANSSMLWLMGVDADTPDPAPGISYFARDENGELTGWMKEFAAVPYLTKFMLPDQADLRANLLSTLNRLSSMGVTTLFDAGNLASHDAVYTAVAELDSQGLLPVRYEGSYHIIFPEQIDNAVAELKKLRKNYGGERLKFNTIKVHLDGVTEVGTAALIEPYANQPELRGSTLFDADRLSRLILELNAEKIDLHVHVVGDRATRVALDAVESARKSAGPLDTRITLSHLEVVHPADIARFRELGVFANFTPHWFGGLFGDGIHGLGHTRAHSRQLARSFIDRGARATFSSDVTVSTELNRANPFLGMQMAATRKEATAGAQVYPPASEIITSMDSILRAYTINGARQLGMEEQIGTIEAGKRADLLILNKDPLDTPIDAIHTINPDVVILDGEVVQGKL